MRRARKWRQFGAKTLPLPPHPSFGTSANGSGACEYRKQWRPWFLGVSVERMIIAGVSPLTWESVWKTDKEPRLRARSSRSSWLREIWGPLCHHHPPRLCRGPGPPLDWGRAGQAGGGSKTGQFSACACGLEGGTALEPSLRGHGLGSWTRPEHSPAQIEVHSVYRGRKTGQTQA